VCEGWPFPNLPSFVHGHAENGNQTTGERADERFMYLPLPTINPALGRVESIRRVLIAVPPGFQDRLDWIRRRLPGQELVWDTQVIGLLNPLPDSDWVLRQYTAESHLWSTVSPVVLPGFDDRDAEKAERLLRNAFGHAGFSEEVVRGLTLEWRNVGFRAGVDLASRFKLPDRLHGPRYHVRVRFAQPIRGPLAVGAGRYRGMGLFAAESE
jgi:CRISPR-associated protein Csb2